MNIGFNSYDFQTVDPVQNWIGGEWSNAASGQSLDVENPRHGKTITQVTMSGESDVQAAVEVAKAAFPSWRDTPMKERVQVLFRLKHLMERDLDKLAWIVSHENGKTFAESKGSVLKAIECVEFGCSIPNMIAGGISYVSRGVTCSMHHEPVGVVAGVTPFNFPMMVPFWMLPQALVAGNTFILKPSEQVPLSPTVLAQLFREAGLPDGVFNVVHGGPDAVGALVDHTDVKAMAFVGSTTVAKELYARGAKTGRPMLCLGSAKNHLIVVPDAHVEMTSDDVVRSFSGCAGQRCMAASVMVAVGKVDPIIDAVVAKASRLKLGEDVGPIINKRSLDCIADAVDEAEKTGATIRLDGRGKSVEGASGHWFGPTVLDNVKRDMPCYTQEIFGPVFSIVHVDTLDEALELENSHQYGNGGAIYTSSGSTARYAAHRINAGMTGVNIGIPVPREPYSFGGWEFSKFGHGDITGMDGFLFWTRPRKLTIKWSPQPDATWMS